MYQQCLAENQPAQAMKYLLQHLKANRQHAFGFFKLGILSRELGNLPEALSAFLEACRIDPMHAAYHVGLGVTYRDLQQVESAIRAFDQALAIEKDPETIYLRAMALLQIGRYEDGWRECELRVFMPKYKSKYGWQPPEMLWQGNPFPGQTLLVYGDMGGMGDDIQFCRFISHVKSLGGEVIFATKKELISIFSTLHGVDRVIEQSPAACKNLKFHWSVPLMSLPHLLHTRLNNLPNQVPYLSVPATYREKWRKLLAPYPKQPGKKKIGVVYASVSDMKIKSCPFSQWLPLFSLPGLQWFSLQKGEAASDAGEYTASHSNFVDLSGHINDFADTAALLDQMDLLISIDTSVPHMAGALGKTVWLVLPYAADWRWLLYRSDCPWYPSFSLYRQPMPGQWQPVMEQIRQALLTFAALSSDES